MGGERQHRLKVCAQLHKNLFKNWTEPPLTAQRAKTGNAQYNMKWSAAQFIHSLLSSSQVIAPL